MKAEQRILDVLRNYPKDGCWGYDLMRLARVRSGRMYPILARLETEGVVESWWAWAAEPGPRRRRYRLVRKPSPFAQALNEALTDDDVHVSLWSEKGP